jgi:hypothetical protein
MIIKPEVLPEMEYYTGGQDFSLNIGGVKIGYHEGHDITTKTFNDQLIIKVGLRMTSPFTVIRQVASESRR